MAFAILSRRRRISVRYMLKLAISCSRPNKIAQADDILLSGSGTGRTDKSSTGSSAASDAVSHAVRPETGVVPRFLLHAFRRFRR